MKRTKSINLNRMRKCFPKSPLALAVAASTLALSGCGEEKVEAQIFKTLDECIAQGNEQAACEIAYKNAKAEAEKAAPKYRTLAECQAEFGPDMCRGGNNDSGSFFMPFMAGYMMSSMLDDMGDYDRRRYTTTPIFTSSSPNSRYYKTYSTASGSPVAKVGQKSATVNTKTYAPKPKATVSTTKSRGGFGAKAAAKSSGGSKASSSSRGGWGG